jgi:hypothetical protein
MTATSVLRDAYRHDKKKKKVIKMYILNLTHTHTINLLLSIVICKFHSL